MATTRPAISGRIITDSFAISVPTADTSVLSVLTLTAAALGGLLGQRFYRLNGIAAEPPRATA